MGETLFFKPYRRDAISQSMKNRYVRGHIYDPAPVTEGVLPELERSAQPDFIAAFPSAGLSQSRPGLALAGEPQWDG